LSQASSGSLKVLTGLPSMGKAEFAIISKQLKELLDQTEYLVVGHRTLWFDVTMTDTRGS
jgi:hypothetical protein